MDTPYRRYCSRLKDTKKYRQLPDVRSPLFTLNFSTNDYLGFSRHPDILSAALCAAQTYGIGATGSRLLSGHNALFEDLEQQIAADKETESALIFNSGFQANLSVLASLLDIKVLGARPRVFFDKLNHASLYQAILLSGAELVRYQHCDLNHLSDLLTRHQNDSRPRFIVTETLFGMDGDMAPLQDIAMLAETHRAFLYLDEAHATGVIGQAGYGLSTTVNFGSTPVLIMGTFSKALGCSGAYVACSETVKDYVLNHASGLIYTTAPSPMVMGAVTQAWRMVRSMESTREKLQSLGMYLRTELRGLGLNCSLSSSHIVPLIVGSEDTAMHLKDTLKQEGIIVSAIRPPTVPPGTSRLRIGLCAYHTYEDVSKLLETLTSGSIHF